jgi:hypothetical protein
MSIQKKLRRILQTNDELYIKTGIVTAVSGETCTVQSAEDEADIFEEVLWAFSDTKNRLEPSVGSYVWLGFFGKNDAVVLHADSLKSAKIEISGQQILFDGKGFYLGTSPSSNLLDTLESLIKCINQFVDITKTLNYNYTSPGGVVNTGPAINSVALDLVKTNLELVEKSLKQYLQ